MVGHADDDIRLIRRFGGTLIEERLEAVACHSQLRLYLVENTEVVVIDHAVDVTLVAELGRPRQKHDTEDRGDNESGDEHPDGFSAVRKNSYRHLYLFGFRPRLPIVVRPQTCESIEVYLHTGTKVRHDRSHVFLSDSQRTGWHGCRITGEIFTGRCQDLCSAIERDFRVRKIGDGSLAPWKRGGGTAG